MKKYYFLLSLFILSCNQVNQVKEAISSISNEDDIIKKVQKAKFGKYNFNKMMQKNIFVGFLLNEDMTNLELALTFFGNETPAHEWIIVKKDMKNSEDDKYVVCFCSVTKDKGVAWTYDTKTEFVELMVDE